MTKYKYHSRKFLTKKQGMQAIECQLDSWPMGDGIDASINITDGRHCVNMYFNIYNLEDLPTEYMQIKAMRDELDKLYNYVTDNYEDIAASLKEASEVRKQRLKKKAVKVVESDEL